MTFHGMLARVSGSEFIRHNTVFFFGSLLVGGLNYLYYPVLGRLLEPVAFGEVQALVTLFLQLLIFMAALGTLTVNIVANHGAVPAAQRTILEVEKMALAVSLLGLVVTLIAGQWLQEFFKFDSTLPFVVLALATVVTVPATFRTAFLRGHKEFAAVSLANLIGAGAKIVLSAVFVLAGWGVTGAMLGLVVAQGLSFWYASYRSGRQGFGPSLRKDLLRLPNIRLIMPELKYAGLVLAGSLSVTLLYSLDVIAVKHYFDAHSAGLYAGVATVARIIFFLTASVAQVLMPAVRLTAAPGRNRAVLLRSLALTAGLGGVALLLFCLAPRWTIGVLMGREYLEQAYLLPRLALVVFVTSLLNLLVMYYIALRKYAIGFIGILGVGVTCGLVATNHGSLQAIVDSMVYGVAATAVVLVIWMAHKTLRGGWVTNKGGV